MGEGEQRTRRARAASSQIGLPLPEGAEVWCFAVGRDDYAVLGFPVRDLRPLDGLTESELQIARAWLRGQSARAIARERGTSPFTVRNQIRSIYQKSGAGSRRELALRLGVVPDGG